MPGALLWGYYLADKKWIPLQVDENGYVKVDLSDVALNDLADVSVATPSDGDFFYYDDATSLWKSKPILWTPQIYTTQIAWLSLDGFTQTLPAGSSITPGAIAVIFKTGATLNNDCGLYSTYGFNNVLPAGKELTIEFPLSYLNSITNQRGIMLFLQYAAYPPTETNRHIGFIIDNGDLYSSSADGTTQETQDTGVNLATSTQLTFCKVVAIGGVSAKFYVNDVLKTTHTTNIPAAGAWAFVLLMGLRTLAAADKWLGVERVIISKKM